jgi:hypothetical protein
MSQSDLVSLALQGDAESLLLFSSHVAVLLNRQLQSQMIVAKVHVSDGIIHVLLESDHVPDPAVFGLVQDRITRLHVPTLRSLHVYGRQQSNTSPAWKQDVALTEPAAATMPAMPQADSGYADRWVQSSSPGSHLTVPRMERTEWRVMAASLLLACILLISPQLTALFSPFLTLVHELGHAFCAWIFGYAAIPAFDFMFGGGITFSSGDRVPLLVAAICVGFVYLFYRYRQNYLTSRYLLGTVLVYGICFFTQIHTALITAMGHGSELIFAGIFLYRALSGIGCRVAIERPLYGMLAFYTVFYDIRFAYRLITNLEVRLIYEEGKGGLLDNDFVILANQALGVDLSIVASVFLILCLLTPVVAILLFRYQNWMMVRLSRLFLITSDQPLR